MPRSDQSTARGLPLAALPKLSLTAYQTFPHHRGGWAYALDALEPLLKHGGVEVDPFIEATFNWDLKENEDNGKLPYRQDWIAIIHNPPGIPEWHEFDSAPQSIFKLDAWQRSQSFCKGIYVFSETMAAWVREQTDIPVAAAVHPTEPADQFFTMDKLVANPAPRIIQVGSWLRRMHSIARLRVKDLRKTLLAPRVMPDPHLETIMQREARNDPAARSADWSSVEFLPYRAPEDFDNLLAANIVFLDLYDTVVNNTVLECIVRRTPLLCNRLPSLVELLGADYPLFFDDLEEAAAKADDLETIGIAHQHLAGIPVERFSQESFRESLVRAGFYRDL